MILCQDKKVFGTKGVLHDYQSYRSHMLMLDSSSQLCFCKFTRLGSKWWVIQGCSGNKSSRCLAVCKSVCIPHVFQGYTLYLPDTVRRVAHHNVWHQVWSALHLYIRVTFTSLPLTNEVNGYKVRTTAVMEEILQQFYRVPQTKVGIVTQILVKSSNISYFNLTLRVSIIWIFHFFYFFLALECLE